jgi:hypothetical protein
MGPNIGPTPISWVCRYSDVVRLPGLVDQNPEPLVAATVRPKPGGVVVLRRFVLNALIFLAVAAVLLLLSRQPCRTRSGSPSSRS